MRFCTWHGCDLAATRKQVAEDGAEWADLCDAHNREMEKALDDADPQGMMRCWILVGGGAAKIAEP